VAAPISEPRASQSAADGHVNDLPTEPPMSHYIASTLLTRDQIQDRIEELAADIERDSPGESPIHLVGVLKGGFMFLADLARAMGERVTLDFMSVTSYGKDTKTSGEVRLLKDLDTSIEGRDVVIIEDIVDTGLTLTYLQDILRARAPRRLRSASLLSKPARRLVDVRVDYVGFDIDDHFVVGYGLDFAEQYRNLPYIGVLGRDGD
jgi:hypoxanthine phosphoribosyltransferase